jgi:hypothetical protein
MTQPTVPPNDGRVDSHVGTTPSTGPFQIDFPFMNLGEIVVEIAPDGPVVVWTVLVYGSQYTVAATANEDGSYTSGTVTLVTAVANTTVRRFRRTQIERLSNYSLNGYFDRLSLNAEMNRYVMCLQDFDRRLVDVGGEPSNPVTPGDYPLVGRVLQTPTGEAPVGVTAGLVAARASKLLAWDAGGSLINSAVTLAQMETVVGAGVPNLAPYALLDSPLFTGDPRAPTPATADSDQSIATTAFVKNVAALGPAGTAGGDLTGTYPNPVLAAIITAGTVGAFNQSLAITVDAKGRVTTITPHTITPGDIGAAPNNSPTLTGNPTAPVVSAPHLSDQTIATTKYVSDSVAAAVGGSTPTGPAGGDLSGTYPNPPLKSSVGLAGAPTVVSVVPAANNDQTIATTKFVKDQAYQTIAGMPTIPTTLPPNGPAGGVLSGTYPNPGAGPGLLRFYNEQVLAVAAQQLVITIPASAKLVMLDFALQTASGSNDTGIALQAMVSGTPVAGTVYNSVLTVNAGATPSGSSQLASPQFNLAAASLMRGTVYFNPFGALWMMSGGGYGFQTPSSYLGLTFAGQITVTPSTVTGFRLASMTPTNWAIGSYLRALVLT